MKHDLAYRTMVCFLEARYQSLPSDELAILLGELNLDLWADGSPADPAVTEEWQDAAARAKQEMLDESRAALQQVS